MSNFLQADMLRGRKNIVVTRDGKLGERVLLSDRSTPGIGPESAQTGMQVEAIIVKATTALSSPAGLGVKFTAAGYGTLVDTFHSAGDVCDGVVDPDLSGNIAVDDTFLLFRYGPVNVIYSGATAVGPIKTANSGKFQAATTESCPVRSGRCLVAATGADQSRRTFINCNNA